jgi:hypothetical protein
VKTIAEAGLKVGKALFVGFVQALDIGFHSVTAFFTGIPGKIEKFFKDAGKWLLSAGKSLVDGLIKGALDAPLDGLKAVGKGILHGISSVFHIFSPSKDTQPLGAELTNGLVKGAGDQAANAGAKVTTALAPLIAHMKLLVVDAEVAGRNFMQAFAKGIVEGGALVAAAVDKVAVVFNLGKRTGASAGDAAHAAGVGGLEIKKQALEVAKLSDARLQELTECCHAQQVAAMATVTLLREATVMITNDLNRMDDNLTERGNIETNVLVQSLQIDRLNLTEARTQTTVLKALLVQAQKPQQVTLKPTPGTSALGGLGNAANSAGKSIGALASAILG